MHTGYSCVVSSAEVLVEEVPSFSAGRRPFALEGVDGCSSPASQLHSAVPPALPASPSIPSSRQGPARRQALHQRPRCPHSRRPRPFRRHVAAAPTEGMQRPPHRACRQCRSVRIPSHIHNPPMLTPKTTSSSSGVVTLLPRWRARRKQPLTHTRSI